MRWLGRLSGVAGVAVLLSMLLTTAPASAFGAAPSADFGAVPSQVLPAADGSAPQAPRLPGRDVMRMATGAAPGATVWGNLTITRPVAAGWAVAYPCDAPRPLASNVNFAADQTVANFVGVRTDSRGAICLYSTADTHVVFDLVAASDVVPATSPVRIMDTRELQFGTGTPLPARGVLAVQTGAAAGSTVWGNLTVVNPAGGGWAVAYPCDQPRPLASNINYAAGSTRAGFVAVQVDPQGAFCVSSSAGAHVVFDQVAASAAIVAAPPTRLLDTRLPEFGGAPLPIQGSVAVVTGAPARSTVWGTLTIPAGSASGWAVAYPCDSPPPQSSNVNYSPGQSVANLVAVRTDSDGRFCIYSSGSAHAVFDGVIASDAVPASAPVRKTDSRIDWSGPGQVVTVRVENHTTTRATIAMWQRGEDGTYAPVRGPVLGWVGEQGTGDGQFNVARTPEGAFAFTETFGILSNPGTQMPYFKVDRYDWWDGNPDSPTFNTHVRADWVPGLGSERLINYGYAYYYAAAFNYNPEQNPAKGSAFFLHVSTNGPTGGCISVPLADMAAILRAMDPQRAPVITIGVGGWGTFIVDRANRV